MTKEELEKKLAELEAENEQLKAERAEPVTDASGAQMVMYVPEKLVKIELFKDDYRYKKPLFVAINGRNWVIQRGVEVEVPDYVADFIKQQRKEEQIIVKRLEEEEQAFRKMEDDINRQAAKV